MRLNMISPFKTSFNFLKKLYLKNYVVILLKKKYDL